MNVLDENISTIQRQLLRGWHIPVRHIGYDVGRKGMKDDEVIPFLLTLRHPTFFTLDWDYFERGLCHARYCLVYLDVSRDETAVFIRRLLRHQEFDTMPNVWEQSSVFRTPGFPCGGSMPRKRHTSAGYRGRVLVDLTKSESFIEQ